VVLLKVVFLLFRTYIIKRLEGYTGDVLGALQQISEVLFYLVIAAKIQ
jgi:adenosylcobinamide-GDP ribazoletransferase